MNHFSGVPWIRIGAPDGGNVCKNLAGILTILRDREAKALVLQELREQVTWTHWAPMTSTVAEWGAEGGHAPLKDIWELNQSKGSWTS